MNDVNAEAMEEFIIANDLAIFNEDNNPPTFETINGQSNIDLTLGSVGIMNSITSWTVHRDINCSDHNPITFEFNDRLITEDPELKFICDPNKLEPEFIRDKISNIVSEIDMLPGPQSKQDIDNLLAIFYDRINREIVSHSKQKTYPNRPQWWTHKVERFRKIYHAKKTLFYRNRVATDRDFLYNQMNSAKADFRNHMITAQNASWKNFVDNDLTTNPWGTVYKIACDKFKRQGILNSFKTENSHTKSPEETMNFLLDSLLPDDDLNNLTAHQNSMLRDFIALTPLDGIPLEPVSEEELDPLIASLSTNKAPGHDLIKGKFIKITHDITKPFFLKIFSACVKFCHFPSIWKTGNLKVLLKNPSKDISSVSNYRPITLLPEYGKIFEKIIRNRLFRNTPQPHSPKQYGFTPGRSTTDALSEYIKSVNSFSNYKYVASIFIDISGAFDNLWWPSLINALMDKNIPHNLIALIKNYLTNRKLDFSTGGLSASKILSKGCPQGSVLGPSLWNVQLDTYLKKELPPNVIAIAYADDIVKIIASNSRQGLIRDLQQMIDDISTWAANARLSISVTKTKILINKAPPRTHNRDLRIFIDGSRIEIVREHKYLGTIIDSNLTFNRHISEACKRANQIIISLRKKIHRTWSTDFTKSLTTIYRCAIIPILSYGIEIWGHKLNLSRFKAKLNSLHGSFCRMLIRGYQSISNDAACIIAGIPPLT